MTNEERSVIKAAILFRFSSASSMDIEDVCRDDEKLCKAVDKYIKKMRKRNEKVVTV